jgi:hypothetical protein
VQRIVGFTCVLTLCCCVRQRDSGKMKTSIPVQTINSSISVSITLCSIEQMDLCKIFVQKTQHADVILVRDLRTVCKKRHAKCNKG